MTTKRIVILAIVIIAILCAGCGEKEIVDDVGEMEDVSENGVVNASEHTVEIRNGVIVDTTLEEAESAFLDGVSRYHNEIYDEALRDFNRATELDPSFARAWYNKGVTLDKLGRHDEAQVCYDKAKELGYTG